MQPPDGAIAITDVTVLIKAGVVDRGNDGVVFPYDAIHVEFDIQTAA